MKLYTDFVFFNHLMLQVPSCPPAEFGHNRVAFTEHIDVEIDMLARLSMG